MPQVVALRDKLAPETLIIGNGDVKDIKEGHLKAKLSGADGIMYGRAIFGNPWLFLGRTPADLSPDERIEKLITLTHYFQALQPSKSFHILKKHFKAFVSGYDGAAELRTHLMETNSVKEMEEVLQKRTILVG
ncbi:tRNA-dihydrouridine synthase [Patescibacteria group bacterium]|nr:tRNA-dihydrouridine synthase [Patescibacteria group bacterium]